MTEKHSTGFAIYWALFRDLIQAIKSIATWQQTAWTGNYGADNPKPFILWVDVVWFCLRDGSC